MSIHPPERELAWYGLYVRPNYEKVVVGKLEQRGWETVLPLYRPRDPAGQTVATVPRPLFPNYVFGRFDLDQRHEIVALPGVLAIAGFVDGMATPIPEGEVATLRRVLDSELPYGPAGELPLSGDRVQVVGGALRGLVGRAIGGGRHRRVIFSITSIAVRYWVQVPVEHLGESERPLARDPESSRRRRAGSAGPRFG